MNTINEAEQIEDYRTPLFLGVAASMIVQVVNVAMGGDVAPHWAYICFSILAFASLALAAFRVRSVPGTRKISCGLWLIFGLAAAVFQFGMGLNM